MSTTRPPADLPAGQAAGSLADPRADLSAGSSADPANAEWERFRAAFWRANRELDSLRLRQWEHSHLTLPQLRVLFQVRRTPGITTGQLARCLGVTVSTTSGLVAKLADGGLVARGSTAGDRRQIPLELTEAGRALAGELAEYTRPFLEAVAAELGDDLETVTAALERLFGAAEAVRRAEIIPESAAARCPDLGADAAGPSKVGSPGAGT